MAELGGVEPTFELESAQEQGLEAGDHHRGNADVEDGGACSLVGGAPIQAGRVVPWDVVAAMPTPLLPGPPSNPPEILTAVNNLVPLC